MRLFEVTIIHKVFSPADRRHQVDRKVALASDEAQARERVMAAELLPETVIAMRVEDLEGATVGTGGRSRFNAAEVRAILRSPHGWTVVSEELSMPQERPFRL